MSEQILITGEPLVVNGDGSQTRDFTYIADVVRANERLLNTDDADGAVLNIGSTDTIEIRELALVVRELIDPGVRIEFDDRHPADADHTHADISKASELIDYRPETSIREGIRKSTQWFEQNNELYRPGVAA